MGPCQVSNIHFSESAFVGKYWTSAMLNKWISHKFNISQVQHLGYLTRKLSDIPVFWQIGSTFPTSLMSNKLIPLVWHPKCLMNWFRFSDTNESDKSTLLAAMFEKLMFFCIYFLWHYFKRQPSHYKLVDLVHYCILYFVFQINHEDL